MYICMCVHTYTYIWMDGYLPVQISGYGKLNLSLLFFTQVDIKVTTQVAIENVEIGVSDKDQTSAPRTTK